MNMDFSQLPPEERALRYTALLLGELPASEAFELDRNDHVEAWVKNDHLGVEIVYVYRGAVEIDGTRVPAQRMAILKMLAEKKITAQQAEELLNALEGGK